MTSGRLTRLRCSCVTRCTCPWPCSYFICPPSARLTLVQVFGAAEHGKYRSHREHLYCGIELNWRTSQADRKRQRTRHRHSRNCNFFSAKRVRERESRLFLRSRRGGTSKTCCLPGRILLASESATLVRLICYELATV